MYQINEADANADGQDTMSVILEVPKLAWVGFAFNNGDGGMVGSEAVIGMTDDTGGFTVLKYNITGRGRDTIVPFSSESQTLIDPSMMQQSDAINGNTTTLQFTKILIEEGEIPIIKNATNTFLTAWGIDNTFGYHGPRRANYTQFLEVGDAPSPAPAPETPAPDTCAGPFEACEIDDDCCDGGNCDRIISVGPPPVLVCSPQFSRVRAKNFINIGNGNRGGAAGRAKAGIPI